MLAVYKESTGKVVYTIERKYSITESNLSLKTGRNYLITDEEFIRSSRHRIINGQAKLLPFIKLSTDKTEIDISTKPTFTLTVDITDTLEDETFDEVNIYVEDATFTVNLTENQGSINIELTNIGKYWIECKDDEFRSEHLQVEAI